MVVTLTTERLILRPFRQSDLDVYAAMSADPDVMRFLGDGKTLDRDDAWRQMAMLIGHWHLRGYGMWAVEEKASGAFVGRVGLHYPEGWPGEEVGWTLVKSFWGRGYATEAARASLAYAFETLGWPRAISLIVRENERSIAVAQRLGQRYDRESTLRGRPAQIYAIDRRDWKNA